MRLRFGNDTRIFAASGIAVLTLTTMPHLAVEKAHVPPPCAANHVNVEGYDANEPPSYGNEGSIYVLTQAALNGIDNNIYRSLFVRGPGGSSGNSFYNDVEVGWTAGNGILSNTPVVYSEWVIDGQDSGQQNYTGYTLNPNTNYHFKVENVGGNRIFRFIVDGQSGPFNYSPQVAFNYGYDITNSEHHNNCDTLYANFTDLQWSPSYGAWSTSGYQDYQCFADNSTDWYFHKNSNTSSDVTQNPVGC